MTELYASIQVAATENFGCGVALYLKRNDEARILEFAFQDFGNVGPVDNDKLQNPIRECIKKFSSYDMFLKAQSLTLGNARSESASYLDEVAESQASRAPQPVELLWLLQDTLAQEEVEKEKLALYENQIGVCHSTGDRLSILAQIHEAKTCVRSLLLPDNLVDLELTEAAKATGLQRLGSREPVLEAPGDGLDAVQRRLPVVVTLHLSPNDCQRLTGTWTRCLTTLRRLQHLGLCWLHPRLWQEGGPEGRGKANHGGHAGVAVCNGGRPWLEEQAGLRTTKH
eukprot:g19683.t1